MEASFVTLITTLISVGVGAALHAFFQRGAHSREREARREEALRDAYADWAGKLDRQFDLIVSAVGLGTGEWADLRQSDAELRTAMYRLLLLEPNSSRRDAIKKVTGALPDWRQQSEREVFSMQMHGEDGPSRPYRKPLAELLDQIVTEDESRSLKPASSSTKLPPGRSA